MGWLSAAGVLVGARCGRLGLSLCPWRGAAGQGGVLGPIDGR
jgi:hypothetical protein